MDIDCSFFSRPNYCHNLFLLCLHGLFSIFLDRNNDKSKQKVNLDLKDKRLESIFD